MLKASGLLAACLLGGGHSRAGDSSAEGAAPAGPSATAAGTADLGWYMSGCCVPLDGIGSPGVNTTVMYSYLTCDNDDLRRGLEQLPGGVESWVQLGSDLFFEAYHDCRHPKSDTFALTPNEYCGFSFNRTPTDSSRRYCEETYLAPVRDTLRRIHGFGEDSRIRGWYLFDEPSQKPVFHFSQGYGDGNAEDDYLVGDWDGDGDDNLAVLRDGCAWQDLDGDGFHDRIQCFGRGDAEDQYLVGDWDGDGDDNLAFRDDGCVFMDIDGDPAHVLRRCYGDGNAEDQYLVGQWDDRAGADRRNRPDRLAVRRDGCVLMDTDGWGNHDRTQCYGDGDAEDAYLVGDWDGDGVDNLAVRRGNCVWMDFDGDSIHDHIECYDFDETDNVPGGQDVDQYLAGEWDGPRPWCGVDGAACRDSRDRVALRRHNRVLARVGGMRDQPWLPETMREIRDYIRGAELELGFTPRPVLGVLDYHVIETPATYGELSAWQDAADVVGMDFYPKGPGSPAEDFLPDQGPGGWGWSRAREIIDRLAANGRPAYYVAQAQGPTSGRRLGYAPAVAPTLPEIRWSAWTPLIQGLEGTLFWWWPFSDLDHGLDSPTIRESVQAVAEEIETLNASRILRKGKTSFAYRFSPPDANLAVALRSYQGSWYLLVANETHRAQTVVFSLTLPPPACSKVGVTELIRGVGLSFQSLTCPSGPATFRDHLEEGAVRAYRLFDPIEIE
jgi:hypothetical protein